MSNRKRIILALLTSLVLFGCNGQNKISEKSSLIDRNEMQQQKTVSMGENSNAFKISEKEKKYSFEELDLYEKTGIDRESHNIDVLDAEEGAILFQVDVPRKGNEMGEGILNQTEEIYVYKSKEDKVKKIATFENYYVLEGYLNNDSYIIMGVKLDGKGDSKYSVLNGSEGGLEEIHEGIKTFSFAYWPELIKLNSGLILFEPEMDKEDSDKITGMNFYKFKNNKFEKEDLHISKDFQILQTEVSNDGEAFISFWENKKEEQAYFIYIDKNGNNKKIAFPKENRLLSFALSKNNILASVQMGDDESVYKMLLFDIDSGLLGESNFQYIHRMTSLPSVGKVMAMMGDNNVYSIEVKKNELNYEKIVADGIEPSKLSEKILFNGYNNKVIFSFFTTERFMETEIK